MTRAEKWWLATGFMGIMVLIVAGADWGHYIILIYIMIILAAYSFWRFIHAGN
jgi:hypothetical protein